MKGDQQRVLARYVGVEGNSRHSWQLMRMSCYFFELCLVTASSAAPSAALAMKLLTLLRSNLAA